MLDLLTNDATLLKVKCCIPWRLNAHFTTVSITLNKKMTHEAQIFFYYPSIDLDVRMLQSSLGHINSAAGKQMSQSPRNEETETLFFTEPVNK